VTGSFRLTAISRNLCRPGRRSRWSLQICARWSLCYFVPGVGV